MQGIYVISSGQYIKIGASTHVRDRVRDLQVSNAVRLNLMAIIPTNNPKPLEAQIHSLLRRHYQGRGEWYRISFRELEWFLREYRLRLTRVRRTGFWRRPLRTYPDRLSKRPRLERLLNLI